MLAPGSQQVDLVVTQVSTTGTGVGVQPSVRLPLTVIKEDGAVSTFALSGLALPGIGLTLPTSIKLSLANSGNTVAIPRGYLTISGPSGTLVAKGLLNSSSLAVVPGGKLILDTPINRLKPVLWPGIYTASVSYGLGGDRPSQTTTKHFFYMAWWQAAGLVVTAVGLFFTARHARPRIHHRRSRHRALRGRGPPKKTLLIGRDIS